MLKSKTVNLLATEIAGIKLKNPIMPASGCFGFGREYAKFYDLSLLGGIAIKATSWEPRSGNWTPRVAETPAGMLNSIGLQNPGVDKVISEELAFLAQYDTAIFANVAGNAIEDYVNTCIKLNKTENVSAIELNVSCPNVHNGILFGSNEESLEALTREVKRNINIPLFVKLSPNVTSVVSMAKAAQRGGADGLSLINTLLGMRIDLKTRKPILARGSGGLSGPAIKPVAIRMIYEVASEINLPIIGMGGIQSLDDALEFFFAGASVLAVGTANFIDPFICPELIKALENHLESAQIKSLKEIIGAALNHARSLH